MKIKTEIHIRGRTEFYLVFQDAPETFAAADAAFLAKQIQSGDSDLKILSPLIKDDGPDFITVMHGSNHDVSINRIRRSDITHVIVRYFQ